MHSLAHLLALISLPTLQTQPDTNARISGHALSAYNGRPIAGVTISVAKVERFTVTDSNGGVTLSGASPWVQRPGGLVVGRHNPAGHGVSVRFRREREHAGNPRGPAAEPG